MTKEVILQISFTFFSISIVLFVINRIEKIIFEISYERNKNKLFIKYLQKELEYAYSSSYNKRKNEQNKEELIKEILKLREKI